MVLGFTEDGNLQNKFVYTRDKLLSRMLDAAAAGIKKRKHQLRRKANDLAHELQSALRVTVGFWNIYCGTVRICHLYVTISSFKH